MNEMEREFKWAAVSEKDFDRFLSSLQSTLGTLPTAEVMNISDSYLDNTQHLFSLQKVALRIRQMGGHFEATMKSRTQLVGGMACRRELTLPLQASTRERALAELAARKEWEGYAFGNLCVRFEIQNKRVLYSFSFKNACCEVALDRYTILTSDKSLFCLEVEMELKGGSEQDFAELVQRLSEQSGLKPAKISKVATAEKLLK